MKYTIIFLIFISAILNATSIYDIQYTTNPGNGTFPSEYSGQNVTTGGIVSGIDFNNGRFFITASCGGAWNGLYIYEYEYNVAIGDSVIVAGEVYEYNGWTEISNVQSIEVISSNNPLPEPVEITTWQAANEEAFESVSVKIVNPEVTLEYDQWNEWHVSDGSGSCIISSGYWEAADDDIPIISDYTFSAIYGTINYAWDEFRLHPQSTQDLVSADGAYIISVPSQVISSDSEFSVPLLITFFGQNQNVTGYEYVMEYDVNLLSATGIETANTLSEGGEVSFEQPQNGTVNVSFDGSFDFSGTQTLLMLKFAGVTSGTSEIDFTSFSVNNSDIEFFSVGSLNVQTELTPIGDTLTVIQKPLLNIPEIATPGEEFIIECLADESVTGWNAELQFYNNTVPLEIADASYNADFDRWFLTVSAPEPELFELYDLVVSAPGIETDVTEDAVHLIPEYKSQYSFIHVTDTHLPSHLFYPDEDALTDTSEVVDLREVIKDINLINPQFVLITGDYINEGEMEEFQNRRVYTKAQKMLTEFEVPVYLVSGNHDIGGWWDSPPPQGTARNNWWNFFGWNRLLNPLAAEPYHTQNYSFDYGPTHFIGMEAYINYDDYMQDVYGDESFTSLQMEWLQEDLNTSNGETNVAFYHMDFDDQINLNSLGLDMALYGHIHSNEGSTSNPPYNLATRSACDGNRAYRIIDVNDGILQPHFTVEAGWNGENIYVEFSHANDGTNANITATITNQLSLDFPDVKIKFLLPSNTSNIVAQNGEIDQIDDSSNPKIVYVSANCPADSDISVSITSTVSSQDENTQPSIEDIQLQNHPNPFNPSTEIRFQISDISEPDSATIQIYNTKGQLVEELVIPNLKSGMNKLVWNADKFSSGIYFYKLNVNNNTIDTKKMIMIK